MIPADIGVDVSNTNIASLFFGTSTLFVRGDTSDLAFFNERDRYSALALDLATGRDLPRRDIATFPGKTVLEIGTTGDGNDYRVVEQDGRRAIVAENAIGQPLWSVPAYAPTTGTAVLDSSGRVVIDLVGAERHLFFIDVASGTPAISPPLRPTDHFADVSGTCALVFGQGTAACIDITTGAQRWTTALTGDSVAMWSLDNRDVLLADGEPLALSRFDSNGRRLWRVTIGGAATTTHYRDLVDSENDFFVSQDPDHHVMRWQSSRMAVVVTDGHVRVVDLANGGIASPRF